MQVKNNHTHPSEVLQEQKKIHFIGICGVAMSALAIAFKNAGWEVTGSDAGFYPPVSTNLEKNGINFYPGWHPDRVLRSFSEAGKDGSDEYLVVVGNVASSTNPEWVYVQEHNIPYKSYPEVIAEYVVQSNSIVCAGTYGKTTTAALLSWIFLHCGKHPNYMFGGLLQDDTPSAQIYPPPAKGKLGGVRGEVEGGYSILEGDEYKAARWDPKAKFFHYKPTQLLLTATQWDHADMYPTEESYLDAFRQLVASLPQDGRAVLSDDIATVVIDSVPCNIVTYGFIGADYALENLSLTRDGMAFRITHAEKIYDLHTTVIGEYTAKNIVGCFAMAIENGLPLNDVLHAINTFPGIKRRLEKRHDSDILIFDDIAHSPAKAAATLTTLKKIAKAKIIAVFEPNTGNRKIASIPGYAGAFAAADKVVIPRLTKIKRSANETDEPMDAEALSSAIQKTHNHVTCIEDDETLIMHLMQEVKKDDIIVFLGSHGFRGMIEQLCKQITQ